MISKRLSLERLESRELLAVYTVDTPGFSIPDDGLTSFHEAIVAANSTDEADVIEFLPALAGSTISLGSPQVGGSPTIGFDLTIRGLGSDKLSFRPWIENFNGFLLTSNVAHFAISGVTFTALTTPGASQIGRIVNNSTGELRLEDVVATTLLGDGVVANGGSVTLMDTRLVGSATTPYGASGFGITGFQNPQFVQLVRSEISRFSQGGVRAAGDISVIDSTISDNFYSATGSGFGVRSTNGQVELLRSTVSNNHTEDAIGGGGVSARWGASIVDCTVSDNSAQAGGGVYTQDGPLTIVRSVIRDNTSFGGSLRGGGGAYKAGSMGSVVVADSVFEGNRNMGSDSNGGGLFSQGPIVVSDSTFKDNHTMLGLSAGGGIYAPLGGSIARSLFEDNSVGPGNSDGGAVWVTGNLTVDASTFRNNSTNGVDCDGGAIHMGGGVVSNSTFVGNRTLQRESDGGAIGFFGGGGSTLTVVNTTITDNATVKEYSDGGGIYVFSGGVLNVRFSTIAGNRVEQNLSRGGGVALGDFNVSGTPTGTVNFWHSIVSDNTSAGSNPDLYFKNNNLASNYTLIENTSGLTAAQVAAINAGAGNLVGVDPMLGPLTDNGGRTLTRLLQAGSPAIDAGDPAATGATPHVPAFDQRGLPYLRIAGGRAELGAVEVQPTPAHADFDHDFDVDGGDFLAWQRGFGLTAPAGHKADGDADNDQDVDGDDLAVWVTQLAAPATGSIAAGQTSALARTAVAADAVFSAGDISFLFGDSGSLNSTARSRGRFFALQKNYLQRTAVLN